VRAKKIPMRMCVGCREMKEKKSLLRVVRTQTGDVVIDRSGKTAGRGAYICPSVECLQRAQKQQQLDRALETKISSDIYSSLLEGICNE